MNDIKKTSETIGGYIELQLHKGTEYYPDLIKLNTGRNALEYILRQKGYKKIYIPYYTCEVLLEPIRKLNLEYQFYSIDEKLEPVLNFEIEDNAAFLYTNYFGIKQEAVKRLSGEIKNLIIDNSQAFFSEPVKGIDTFYSCRKFFGVPDGAYLQINRKLNRKLSVDISYQRFSHLIKSIDNGIESAYKDYIENNRVLENNKIMSMSKLTQKILAGIDYQECIRVRKRNFNFLHKYLKEQNLLKFDFPDDEAPMIYPFLFPGREIKIALIQQKIFVATYWPNVFEWTRPGMFENFLAHSLVALPIDHRYTLPDMFHVLTTLRKLI